MEGALQVVYERTPEEECIERLYEITSSKASETVTSDYHVRREQQHQTMVRTTLSENAQNGKSNTYSDIIRSKWRCKVHPCVILPGMSSRRWGGSKVALISTLKWVVYLTLQSLIPVWRKNSRNSHRGWKYTFAVTLLSAHSKVPIDNIFNSELLGFCTFSIVRYSRNYKTRRFGNWICFRLQVWGEVTYSVGSLRQS
jgi:hypothetical protein